MSSNTPKTILLLAANPKGTTPLRLDEEVREIDAGLQRARNRDQFVLEQKWAVRPRDIQRAMLDSEPSIVHFSGHGTGDEGLVFEDEVGIVKLVDGESLAGLFELFADRVECVVLNGCYSEVQATAIARYVNYVIGMNKALGDLAAIEFAVAFYDALGARRPVEFAHKFGCAAIRLAGIPEHLTPVIKKKPGIGETVDVLTLKVESAAVANPKVAEVAKAQAAEVEPKLPQPVVNQKMATGIRSLGSLEAGNVVQEAEQGVPTNQTALSNVEVGGNINLGDLTQKG